jgi:hypothetical protein
MNRYIDFSVEILPSYNKRFKCYFKDVREMLLDACDRFGTDIEIAEELGLGVNTVKNRLHKHGIWKKDRKRRRK